MIPQSTPAKKVVVEWVEDKPEKMSENEQSSKRFVQHHEVPKDQLSQEKKKSKYLSDQEQYVLQEMRAKATGLTQNSKNKIETQAPQNNSQMQSQAPKQAQAFSQQTENKPDTSTELDLKLKNIPPFHKIDFVNANNIDFEIPTSSPKYANVHDQTQFNKQNSQYHPQQNSQNQINPLLNYTPPVSRISTDTFSDAINGDMTALNTSRFTYYTFFNRITESIYPKWAHYAQTAASVYAKNHRIREEEKLSSRLELLLDNQGRFIRGVLHSSSGVTDLDVAPVRAFRDVGQFPNPPAELVDSEDHLIHLHYEFNINVSPQFAAGERQQD